MNNSHTDKEWLALQDQVTEARRLVELSSRVLRRAIAELEEFIQERAA